MTPTRCQAVEAVRLLADTSRSALILAGYLTGAAIGVTVVTVWRAGAWVGRRW